MDQRISEMTAKKQRRLVTAVQNMQQLQDVVTQEFMLKIKFDKDQTNNLKDTKRILIELIQKLDGNIKFLQSTTMSSSSSFRWRPSWWWAAWNWDSFIMERAIDVLKVSDVI